VIGILESFVVVYGVAEVRLVVVGGWWEESECDGDAQ
jgi:hypothetical protein